MSYLEMKKRICDTALKAYNEKLVAGTSGNVSEFDAENGLMAITPSNLSYTVMMPEDIVVMKLDGTVVEGNLKPSSEWRLHAGIYAGMEDVRAVIHTHSPRATSFAVIQERIPLILVEMLPFLGGDIPVAKFSLPGSDEVGLNAVEAMTNPNRNAALLANHGVVAVGKNLDQAYIRAVYTEDAATICHMARQLGTPIVLSEESEDFLREKYNLK